MPDAVMFFAAGFGTRMRPLTEACPKPLIQVAGTPLLDHAISLGVAAEIPRQVVNIHYLGDQIRAHLKGRDIAISQESPKLLDTGGGLKAALPLLGAGPVFTMNTDAVWRGPNPFDLLRAAWRPEDMDALLLCVPRTHVRGHLGKGDFLLGGDGRLSRGPGLVYSGAQIIKTEALHDVTEPVFSLNRLWTQMDRTKRLFGLRYSGLWCDVGQPSSIPVAEALLRGDDV